jgi:hypothetical protein
MAVPCGRDRDLLVVKARVDRVRVVKVRADKARVVRVKEVRARVAVRVGVTAAVVAVKRLC